MFEDSTFESNGRIRTRSRGWMIATFAFNGAILVALILIPLIYPEALPRMAMSFLMEAPPRPVEQPKPVAHVEHVNLVRSQIEGGHIFAPPVIPKDSFVPAGKEIVENINPANMDSDAGPAGNGTNPFAAQGQRAVVRPQPSGPVRVSAPIVEGLLVHKVTPVYPPIAIAGHIEGTVVLQATISRRGTIENLRVVSGPIMLQQAALNAVQQWVYRPYLLNGNPVEVETTVNVIFKLQ